MCVVNGILILIANCVPPKLLNSFPIKKKKKWIRENWLERKRILKRIKPCYLSADNIKWKELKRLKIKYYTYTNKIKGEWK